MDQAEENVLLIKFNNKDKRMFLLIFYLGKKDTDMKKSTKFHKGERKEISKVSFSFVKLVF